MTRQTCGKTTWIDLESPSYEELTAVMEEFDINSRIVEEITTPTPYPLSLSFDNYVYLILHFPTADAELGTRVQEVDFIVGKNFIITARYEVIEPIHALHKVFESEDLLGVNSRCTETRQVLERILYKLYAAIADEVELVARKIERIERDIFSGKEQSAVRTISEAGRTLLRFETALARHRIPLTEFLDALSRPVYLGAKFAEHHARIEARRAHAMERVLSYRAVAEALRTTNDSLLSASQNQITKTLTVVAFIALPLTLIASIFGMNADPMPLVDIPNGFWIIMALMVVAGLAMYAYFRIKRWL